MYKDKQYYDLEELIPTQEKRGMKFNKENIMNLHKSISEHLLKVIDVKQDQIQ